MAGASDDTLRRVADIRDDAADAEVRDADAAAPAPRRRFWTEVPRSERAAPQANADSVTSMGAVRLPGGALLLLPGTPDDADASAIEAAARPLLDLLAERGLLTNDERSTQ